jgi:MSHA biogenesis protein MshK
MISVWRTIFALTAAFAAGAGYAQAVQDPMRPPAFTAPIGGDSAGTPAPGLVLQSTLLSHGRRIAMIDGKPMKVGDKIGGARIVAIDPSSVTLREGETTRVLELFQGVQVTHPNAVRKPVSAAKASYKGK